jgi:ABC-type bacteriocin/lantibiotic exporter with double-glycine peptidase domain
MGIFAFRLADFSDTWRDTLSLLSRKERFHLFFLGALVLMSSFSEVVGIASIIPFLSLVANQSILTENPHFKWVYQTGGFSDQADFIRFLGVGALVIFTISVVINVLAMWIASRWTYLREYSIGKRLFQHYLTKPYLFFIDRHSTEFSKNIFTEIALVINGVFIPGLYLITKSITAITIIIALFIYNWNITLSIVLIFGGFYLFMLLGLNRLLSTWGQKRVNVNESRFRVVSEAFGGIKEVLLYAKRKYFIRAFMDPSRQFAELQAKQRIIGIIPRYLLELFAFGGILMVFVFMLFRGDGPVHIIPMITVYVMAGYRLLPALQNVYSNATKISFNRASLHYLANELKGFKASVSKSELHKSKQLTFNEKAALIDVEFRFDGCDEPNLKDINLCIRPGEKIGLVGETGCGKTTTVNLLVGLLEPISGRLVVDRNEIKGKQIELWQHKIGYVTQQVFLSGASIKQNIAFGEEDKNIDLEEVKRCCRITQIDEFIENELPYGYETFAGERGFRLSGGQIQRIGIARALYRKPEILVMDEATSALDAVTEAKVYDAIYASLRDVAVAIIAHRITTLKYCDRLYLFKKGRIIEEGTYQELMLKSRYFKELATKLSSDHIRETVNYDQIAECVE